MARWTVPHRNPSLRPDLLKCRHHSCVGLLPGVSVAVAVSFSSSGFMAGKRSTSLILLESVRNMVVLSVLAQAPASCWGQPIVQGSTEVLIYEHGLIITVALALACSSNNCHCHIEFSAGIAHFLFRTNSSKHPLRPSLEWCRSAK